MGFNLTIKYYEFYGFLWIGSFCSIEFGGCVLPCFNQLLDLGGIFKHNWNGRSADSARNGVEITGKSWTEPPKLCHVDPKKMDLSPAVKACWILLQWFKEKIVIICNYGTEFNQLFWSSGSSPNIGKFPGYWAHVCRPSGIKFAPQIICQHRPDAALGAGCPERLKQLQIRHNWLDFKAGHCSQGFDRVHWNTISIPPVGKSKGSPCHKRQSHSPVFPNKQNSQSIFWRSNYPTIGGYYPIINPYFDDQIYLLIRGPCWCKSCSWKLIGYPPAIQRNQGLPFLSISDPCQQVAWPTLPPLEQHGSTI